MNPTVSPTEDGVKLEGIKFSDKPYDAVVLLSYEAAGADLEPRI